MNQKKTRRQILAEDLVSYSPRPWRVNIPFRDYKFRVEDLIPAFSGMIGKVALVAAFALAWTVGLNIADPSFVAESVRLEIVLGSLLTFVFCAVLNPYAAPPGTLAPLIPMVPLMVRSGVHPLVLGILIGAFGLILSAFRYFDKLVRINGQGTKGGIILLFGFLGISSSLTSLKSWADSTQTPDVFAVLIIGGIVFYMLLARYSLKWLVIPVCAAAAVIITAVFGLFPAFQTGIGLPIINPDHWWTEKWGVGWGLTIKNIMNALPFALLAVVMWPIDALAVTSIQECHYPEKAMPVMKLNASYLLVSVRNLLASVLGGSQIASVWRSFLIPLAVVKRPIGASALVLGILGIACGFLGYPIDVAVFPPLLWLVLIFGIYIPLLEVGISCIKNIYSAQTAAVCIVGGMAVSPVLGWILSVSIENFGIIKDPDCCRKLSRKDKTITAVLVMTVATVMVFSYL